MKKGVTNRVGSPVRGKDFFGRDRFVDLVWQKITHGNILLAAPRRFGKTSVMYRLIDEPRYESKVIHADLESVTEPADMIVQLLSIKHLAITSPYIPSCPGGSYRSDRVLKTVFTRRLHMKFINKLLRRDEAGATAIEYGLIAALIAVAAIAAMQGLGTSLKGTFNSTSSSMAASSA